jgi:hypothetical protein
MKLGAERKKVAILVALLVVAGIVYFMNSTPGAEDSGYKSPAARPSAPTAAAPARPGAVASERAAVNRGRQAEREFRPSLRRKKNEPAPDPTSIDPTLRMDLLAKLQQVNVEGVRRSIFDFGQAPPPPSETKPAVAAVKGPKAPNPLTPPPPTDPKPVASNTPPPPPQAPPVPMKFFGYVSPAKQPTKKAFFVEGEDIHIVQEGDVVKNRYKIVRIGVNSVVVEDLQFKSQQTVPLEQST